MAHLTKWQLTKLQERWIGHEKELQELVSTIKTDPNWHQTKTYKSLLEALGPFPEGVDEVPKDLRGVPLSGADLSEAHLSETDLSGAILDKANLTDAFLFETNLSGAFLGSTNLSGAYLIEADLTDAYLLSANLKDTNLEGANLNGTLLGGVSYTTDEVFNRLVSWRGPKALRHIPFVKRIKRLKEWKPLGITNFQYVDTSKINASSNPILKRHIEDYQFIHAFKHKTWFHRWIFYPLWKMTSDCGRSLSLWFIWLLGFVGMFTFIYSHLLYEWFNQPNLTWFDFLYFSVITFSTLGFGDVTPKIGNPHVQTWVMAHAIIGYIMLGGLISILANKLARRA
jgi:uncharacterized protein YjbI with pentapeptide repeats